MRKITRYLLIFITLLFLFQFVIQPVFAQEKIEVKYYHSSSCGSCRVYTEMMEEVYLIHSDSIVILWKDVSDKSNWTEWKNNGFTGHPCAIVNNETKIIKSNMKFEYVESVLNSYISGFDPSKVQIKYFYNSSDDSMSSQKTTEVVKDILLDYSEDIQVSWYDITVEENLTNGNSYCSSVFPCIVVDDTVINDNLTLDYVSNIVNASVAEIKQDTGEFIDTPFGRINLSSLSLPILTVILGAVDSLNPCAMFILFILLSLLSYVQSRRRMLLVGGVFIFFSGLWYYVFMFILSKTLNLLEATILALVVGSISIVFGIFNIKDFFFSKKGVSLSIPESKKPGLYRQIRKLVKTSSISYLIFGTIFFSVTVNLFELLCSVQWPLYFVTQLDLLNLQEFEKSLYLVFYCIIYVIPLIIIVLIFVFTLGQKKISEWHGQVMKLFSGVMITCFGVIFLIDYMILENVATPILLLLFSLVVTFVVSRIWKKKFIEENLE